MVPERKSGRCRRGRWRPSEDARQIAHRLHPAVIDDLGLAVSLEVLCEEFSQRHQVNVQFQERVIPSQLPVQVASSVYRITQEALWNAAKHSGTKDIRVMLEGSNGEILLTIEDDGSGFDPESLNGKGGLGLVSMRERARLVNGVLSIESAEGKGTRIVLTVPSPGGGG